MAINEVSSGSQVMLPALSEVPDTVKEKAARTVVRMLAGAKDTPEILAMLGLVSVDG